MPWFSAAPIIKKKAPIPGAQDGSAAPGSIIAPSLPDPIPSSNPVTTTEKTDVPPSSPTWDASGGQYGGLESDVLGQVRKGISGPTDAVKSMITRGNEAVALKAKQVEGQAGARASAAGSLGQGTAANLGQGAQQDILSTLSDANLKNTELVGNEQSQMLDRASGMVQMDNQKQQAYQSTLAGLAASNPTLAAKLQDYLVGGGHGTIGAFTPAEQAEMKAAAEKAGAKQDVLDQIDQLNLENLKGTSKTQLTDQQNSQKLAELRTKSYQSINWNDPANKSYLAQLPNENPIATFTDPSEVDDYVKNNPGAIIKFGGQPYKVVQSNQSWISDGGSKVKTIVVDGPSGRQLLGTNGKIYPLNQPAFG